MAIEWDITTVFDREPTILRDPRTTDRQALTTDQRNIQDDMMKVIKTLESSPKEQKAAPDQSTEHAKKLRDLEKEHSVKLMELISARRLLRQYQRGFRALMTATAAGAAMALSGVATAIVSSLVGVDMSTAVTWLSVFGWPITVASAASAFAWQWFHRINTKWRKSDSYPYNYVRDSVEYVDPQLNVDIAEHNYGIALTRLAEHKGQAQ